MTDLISAAMDEPLIGYSFLGIFGYSSALYGLISGFGQVYDLCGWNLGCFSECAKHLSVTSAVSSTWKKRN
jgi:hypothetical protein